MRRDCQLFVDPCAVYHLNKVGRPQRAQLLHYQVGVYPQHVEARRYPEEEESLGVGTFIYPGII